MSGAAYCCIAVECEATKERRCRCTEPNVCRVLQGSQEDSCRKKTRVSEGVADSIAKLQRYVEYGVGMSNGLVECHIHSSHPSINKCVAKDDKKANSQLSMLMTPCMLTPRNWVQPGSFQEKREQRLARWIVSGCEFVSQLASKRGGLVRQGGSTLAACSTLAAFWQ